MHIWVAHNAVVDTGSPDEKDVLDQVDAVQGALGRLGYKTTVVAVDLALDAIVDRVEGTTPDLVFNLVESLAGSGRMIHCFPSLLDALGIAYTGSPAESLFLSSNKLLAKDRLLNAGIDTPPWVASGSGLQPPFTDGRIAPHQWIIKSVWEHASIGLDENAIVPAGRSADLPDLLAQRAPQLGGDCFAEAFIEGREFNLSVIQGASGPVVLPPAEIVFEGFGNGRPRIVDYKAKWDSDSYAYHHTPRRFDFKDEDMAVIAQLKRMALQCWDLFDLKGYARVDFRVDDQNRPWVLEINANPCISPDAGFAAAVEQSGMTYDQAIACIVSAVRGRDGQAEPDCGACSAKVAVC